MENEFRDENIDKEQIQETEQITVKPKWWKIAFVIFCCAALLVALTVVVLQGTSLFDVLHGWGNKLKPDSSTNNDPTIETTVGKDAVQSKDSYTVSDEVAVESADKVVAVLGDRELTNGQLQFMYWMQVEEFCQYYGYGYFDYTKPLDEQIASEQSGLSWQQYFIELTINMWKRNQILMILAEKESYESVDEYKKTLDQLAKDLEEMAKEDGFESADAMIQKDMGIACTVEDYLYYHELRNVAMLFLSEKYEEWMPDEKTVEAYYAEHEAELKKNGITKESGSLVDVRHILVQLDDVKAESNGKVNYTEDQWIQCQKKAQELLDKWKSGEATETSFAKLANENSKDGGSNTKGGLYQQVEKGMMVEAFDAWIFDASRAYGDTEIVKTEFGYHIMFFVRNEPKWMIAATSSYLSDRVDEMLAQGEKEYPVTVHYDNIALTNVLS